MSFPTEIPALYGIALPTPFEIGTVNCYVAQGDPLTLIDCGVNTQESYQALADGLAEKGCNVKDIRRLILTHHHVDHIGLARRIVDESGAEIWAHPFSAPWIETPAEARANLRRFTSVLFREGGVSQTQIDRMNQVSDYLDNLNGDSVHIECRLTEGETVDMSGSRWQVYHTPGHAGGMLCFYEPTTQVMIASDHLLRDVSSNPLIEPPETPGRERPKRLLDYLREMQRMAALNPRIVYAGHGLPVDDVCTLVESRFAFHQKRADKLYALFGGQPRLLHELTKLLFPNVPESQLYLTLSETLGHLDLLERDGRIASESINGLRYWHSIV